MTAEYLIVAADPDAYRIDPAAHLSVVNVGVIDSGIAINVLTDAPNPLLPGDALIGAWDYTGKAVEDIDHELYSQIRPLGNNEDGTATLNLNAHHFAGWKQRELGDHSSLDQMMRLYQAEESPFAIEIRHKLFNNPAAPAADGWGFHAEIIGGADSRDPSVRSIAAYDDPEYTDVLWPTTGGFIRGPSDWQTDEVGDPIEVWYVDSWDGYRLDEPREWYCALLFSSVMEGKATLPVGSDSIQYLFWERNQGQGGEVQDWVQPTGAHDTYSQGDHVMHNGAEWVSDVDNNSWEPGVYGWSET